MMCFNSKPPTSTTTTTAAAPPPPPSPSNIYTRDLPPQRNIPGGKEKRYAAARGDPDASPTPDKVRSAAKAALT